AVGGPVETGPDRLRVAPARVGGARLTLAFEDRALGDLVAHGRRLGVDGEGERRQLYPVAAAVDGIAAGRVLAGRPGAGSARRDRLAVDGDEALAEAAAGVLGGDPEGQTASCEQSASDLDPRPVDPQPGGGRLAVGAVGEEGQAGGLGRVAV